MAPFLILTLPQQTDGASQIRPLFSTGYTLMVYMKRIEGRFAIYSANPRFKIFSFLLWPTALICFLTGHVVASVIGTFVLLVLPLLLLGIWGFLVFLEVVKLHLTRQKALELHKQVLYRTEDGRNEIWIEY